MNRAGAGGDDIEGVEFLQVGPHHRTASNARAQRKALRLEHPPHDPSGLGFGGFSVTAPPWKYEHQKERCTGKQFSHCPVQYVYVGLKLRQPYTKALEGASQRIAWKGVIFPSSGGKWKYNRE